MPYCAMSEEIYHQEDIMIKSIKDSMKELHIKWLYYVGDNPRAQLDRCLMRQSDSKPGLLECNIDPNILNLCHECFYWISFKFNIPVHIQQIYDMWDTLRFIYESVLAVTLAYNKIIEGLFSIINYHVKVQIPMYKLSFCRRRHYFFTSKKKLLLLIRKLYLVKSNDMLINTIKF